MLLALAGGVGAVAVAHWGGRVVRDILVPDVAWGSALHDPRLLAGAAAAAVAAGLLTGAAPAAQAGGARLLGALRAGARDGGGRRSRTRDALVVVQTASALVLLVGSALLMRSFWQLSDVDAGYDTKDIFTFQIAPSRPELNNRMAVSQFQYAFMDRLKAVPGVESVGFITTLPLDEGAATQNLTTPALQASGTEAPLISYAGAGGAYFQTMGIKLISGRYFERVEEEQGTPLVIVSQSAAKTLFPGEDPIGKQLRPATATGPNWSTVIGVVEDVLVDDLRRKSPDPMVYLPGVSPSPAYVLKSSRADQLEADVKAVIREMIPESPMYRIFTMERLAANASASLSFTMLMISLAAGLALILGAVGLYGVLSYGAQQRTKEIGVRMALGAEATTVRRMFVWQGVRVALLGVVVGLVAAAGLTKYIQTLLFDVGRFDVAAFAAMSAVLLAVALLASYIPAHRASRVNPVIALRSE